MTPRALAAVAAGALLALGASQATLRVSLQTMAQTYYKNVAAMARVTGRDSAFDYLDRLTEDVDLLDQGAPAGYTSEQWDQIVNNIVTHDMDAVTQLLDGKFRPLAQIRGNGETFVRSSADGTMQPLGVYVPTTYDPAKRAPLIVFLHGRQQTETQLLAPPYIQQLAERTGTIVVAPYGRGYYDYHGAEADIYDALAAAQRSFSIDPRKRYLAGYSMGGFSVYRIAPMHPEDWAGVMSIAGSLLGSEAHDFVSQMRTIPIYVLTGSADDSIPTQYPTISASYLRNSGLDVSFYSQKGGLHRLVTLLPILTQAWNDMESGVVRAPPPSMANIPVPTSMQPPTLKP